MLKTANFLVGRFNYIQPNGTFQTIGKVYGRNLYFYQPGDNSETITDGAFEVLTCQPREPVIKCGTLLQYTKNEVTTLGFNSGTYYDGSTVYVGTGNFAQCWSQNPAPSRITNANTFQGPGSYISCSDNYMYDEIDPRFFAAHNDLRWIMANITELSKVEGALKIGYLHAGRINVTMGNGTYQQIGKIYNGELYYRDPINKREVTTRGPYEVLACTPCPYAKLPEEPCCTNNGRGKFCCENNANNVDCCENGGVGKPRIFVAGL